MSALPPRPAAHRSREPAPLKIQVVSDLHLESAPLDPFEIRADALVIAGDTHVEPEEFGTFLSALAPKVPTIVILGNHEYDRKHFSTTLPAFRAAAARIPNVHLLEREVYVVGDVHFVGTNLWTDMRGGLDAPAIARVLKAFDMRGVDVDELMAVHRESLAWLKAAYPRDAAKVVVVTHTAPSFRSQHPRFAGSALNGFFASALDDVVSDLSPQVWIHGHMHDAVDYTIGRTRVLSNPRGYPSENPRWNSRSAIIEP